MKSYIGMLEKSLHEGYRSVLILDGIILTFGVTGTRISFRLLRTWAALGPPQACFVSLKKAGRLRGCAAVLLMTRQRAEYCMKRYSPKIDRIPLNT